MAKICPICKKPVKSTQSQANIPVGKVEGRIETVLCHLECVAKTPMKKLAKLFPYYYGVIKEGGQSDLPPLEESEEQGMM